MNVPYRWALLAVGVAYLWSARADADPTPDEEPRDEVERREEEMFGEEDAEEESDSEQVDADSSESERREEEMFGGEDPAEADDQEQKADLADRFEERLEEENDPLQLGGTYFGRLNYTILEEGDAGEFPVSQPNIADVYFDARPTKRLRFYTQGRLFFDPTVEPGEEGLLRGSAEQLDIDLDQLWLKFDIARRVYVTVGRQQLRWGVGRFWFPNDFLFAQKRDPLAIFDERTGVDLIKAHVPFEELGWNFYAVAQVDGADSFEQFGGAARMEFLFGQTEVGVASTYRQGTPLLLGVDVSTGVWLLDLRAAGSVMYEDAVRSFRGDFDPESLADPDPRNWIVPESFIRDDVWLFQALAGAELGVRVFEDDTFLMGAEYYYNEAGQPDEDLYPWLILQQQFRPFYVGRHYGAVYASLPSPGEWDDMSFTLSTLANLSDWSFLSRFDYRLTMLTRLQFFVFGTLQYGSRGEFNLRVEIPPLTAPGVPPELQNGVVVPAVRGSAGLGFRLDF